MLGRGVGKGLTPKGEEKENETECKSGRWSRSDRRGEAGESLGFLTAVIL